MYKIGITGSIGTGKTTVADMFAIFNIPIFNADNEIRKILTRKEIKKKLKNIWPEILKENSIDKKKLRSIIFSNKKDKRKLESLLYPYLKIESNKFEDLNHRKKILVYDVPLIYETKTEKNYDLILLTNCDRILQKKRVLTRDKISSSLFESIVGSQLSFEEKIKFKPKIMNTNKPKVFIFMMVLLLVIKTLIRLKIRDETRKKVST